MYSGAKTCAIKFAKGIDYVSCAFFPQEEAVMVLTSQKKGGKSDSYVLFFCSNILYTYVYRFLLSS